MKNVLIQILMMATLLLAITGYSQSGVQITINPSPTLYSVTGGGEYCAGLSGVPVGLSGSDTGVNYQLELNGTSFGLPIPGTGSPISFGNQLMSGTLTVIATSTLTGCSIQMSNSATIMVNPIPSITLTASGPVEFCGSGTVTLTANAGGGCTYHWQKNGVDISGANLNQYVANTTGMYNVVVTSTATGCSNDNDTMVMVNPLPQQFSVSSSATSFCEGSSGVTIIVNSSQIGSNYKLTNNGSLLGVPVAGTGMTLNWTNQNIAGTYSVIAEDNLTGCTSVMTGSPVIVMDPLPDNATAITGQASVCQGSTVSFYTNPVLNATSYVWSIPMGATILTGQGTSMITVQFNGSTSGDVTVFGQNSCGGGQPYIFPVTVNLAPTLNITATAMDICGNTATTLTATGTGVSFVWSGGMTTSSITVNPTSTTNYYVTATSANSCTATDDIIITVHTAPVISLDLVEDNICTDTTSITLSGGLPFGGTYSGTCVYGDHVYPTVSGPGTYIITYEITDMWGCSNSATDILSINPTPVVTFEQIVGMVYEDTPPFDLMNKVSPFGGTFTGTGMIGSLFDPALAGEGTHMITYTYTHSVTECAASQIQYISVGPVNIDEITAAVNSIRIFPNPATDQITLISIDTKEITSLQILDILGKSIYDTQIHTSSHNIDVSNFPSGTYLIRFFDADGLSVTKRFMKSE